MKKIKDPILLGIISGLIGNTAKLAGNLFNRYVLYKSEITYPEIASGMFMGKKQRERPVGKLVGFLADYAIGASLGIPMVYMLRYSGKSNAPLKGLGLGHIAWVSMFGFLGGGHNQKEVFPLDAGTNLSAFVNHSWYGLVTALVASRLGDPSLFNQTVTQKQLLPNSSPEKHLKLINNRSIKHVRPMRKRTLI